MSPKALIGRIDWSSVGPNTLSWLLALLSIGLIALGIGLIFVPAGIIAAGLGGVWLQSRLFTAPEPEPEEPTMDNRRR
jgi:hypothetical protein